MQEVCAADSWPHHFLTHFLLPCLAGGGWDCFDQQIPGEWVCLQGAHGLHLRPGRPGFLSSSNSAGTLHVGQWAENHLLPSPHHQLPSPGMGGSPCARGPGPSPSLPLPVTAWGLHFAEPQFLVCPTTLQGCWGQNAWSWPKEVCSLSLHVQGFPQRGLGFPGGELD